MRKLKKVLYVKTDSSVTHDVTLAIERIYGLDVTRCRAGGDMKRVASELRPDLMLLDACSDDRDSETLLPDFRNVPDIANTPAIFMTRDADAIEVLRLLSLGAVDVVTRRLNAAELGARIVHMWDACQRRPVAQGPAVPGESLKHS